ncbi:helix-turn-helix domain-containing protein [Streptomyces cinnamoneus]|uniref:helix-turn-helix domain-containing protein n=1 Tax=Streptomyces cinnamoneus TaxID=53446 RepID=UPI001EFE40D8|nr:helix-turn-helix domain-containing protein [Streptomyces cinnamoneus]
MLRVRDPWRPSSPAPPPGVVRHPSRFACGRRGDRRLSSCHGGTGRTAVTAGFASRGRDPRRHVLRHADAPAGGPPGARPGLGGPGRVRGRNPPPRHGAGDPHVARRQGGVHAAATRVHHDGGHPRRGGDRRGVAGTPGPPGPLDDLLLDRLAIAVAAVVETVRPGPHHHGRPRPRRTGRQLRQRRGGQSPGAPAPGLRPRTAGPRRRRTVPASARPDRWSDLPEPPGEGGAPRRCGRPPGHHGGPGPVPGRRTRGHRRRRKPDRSWREARTALRFATARQPVVHHDELGALALLAQVPEAAASDNTDVAAIARIAGNAEDLETLDAYCATGSLRRAADRLHLHHSSVARRLEQLGKTIGVEITRAHRPDTGKDRPHPVAAAQRLRKVP